MRSDDATLERAKKIARHYCTTCRGYGYVGCVPREGGESVPTLCGNCLEADRDGCGTPQTTRKGDWIQTFTGRQYWPLDPRPADVDIADIAHHLSMLCRYTGACNRFYSVAEHAWHVSFVVPARLALWGLHHDDAEYVCNDIARPVKRSISGYDSIERMNMEAIATALALPPLAWSDVEAIKEADNVMLLAEQRILMRPAPEKWAKIDVDETRVAWGRERLCLYGPMDPTKAERLFLERHAQLTAT